MTLRQTGLIALGCLAVLRCEANARSIATTTALQSHRKHWLNQIRIHLKY